MSADTLILFTGVSVLLCLSPGPDNIYVLSQSAFNGRRVGFSITLGLCMGLVVHTSIVSFGIANLIKSSDVALTVMKWVGALYLAYLSWGAFKAKGGPIGHDSTSVGGESGYIKKGFYMNISNPKVIVFFLALFPQFIDESLHSASRQTVLLGTIFVVVTFFVFSLIAYLSGFLGRYLQENPSIQGKLNKVTGFILLGLSINLAVSQF